jgi:hypothetical protein
MSLVCPTNASAQSPDVALVERVPSVGADLSNAGRRRYIRVIEQRGQHMSTRRTQLLIVLLRSVVCARRALRRAVVARLQRCAQKGCAAVP